MPTFEFFQKHTHQVISDNFQSCPSTILWIIEEVYRIVHMIINGDFRVGPAKYRDSPTQCQHYPTIIFDILSTKLKIAVCKIHLWIVKNGQDNSVYITLFGQFLAQARPRKLKHL